MPMTRYEGRTFSKQVFQLEESWFVNCARSATGNSIQNLN